MNSTTTRTTTSKPDTQPSGDDSLSRHELTSRLSGQYGARFLLVGVVTAYWPVWLESRGLDTAQIGVVSAVATYTATAGSLLIALAVDRFGRGRFPAYILAAALLLSFLPFLGATGFWPLLLISIPFAIIFHATGPVTEAITIGHARRADLDYGKLRLWGSLTFIVTAVGGGALLEDLGPDSILILTLGCVLVASLGVAILPAPIEAAAVGAGTEGRFAAANAIQLLTNSRFALFILVGGLIQGAHGAYYLLGTLHWRAAGISERVIGAFWAEGVVAEIVLFLLGGRLLRRWRPADLLAAAGVIGVVRWGITAETTALAPIAFAQVLHAGTFGATHLAAIHFIGSAAPGRLAVTAQALYAAISVSVGIATMKVLSGALYSSMEGRIYWLPAAACATAALISIIALREPKESGVA